jgi:hypothetical protein
MVPFAGGFKFQILDLVHGAMFADNTILFLFPSHIIFLYASALQS